MTAWTLQTREKLFWYKSAELASFRLAARPLDGYKAKMAGTMAIVGRLMDQFPPSFSLRAARGGVGRNGKVWGEGRGILGDNAAV